MKNWIRVLAAFAAVTPLAVHAAPEKRAATPAVTIAYPEATIVGSTGGSVETFNDVPFAAPPTGPLRLKPPKPLDSPLGTVDAKSLIPKSCPQQYFSIDQGDFPGDALGELLNHPFVQKVTRASEDCLYLNVQRPEGTKAGDKLPVLFWIYGGGFQLGSTQLYNGAGLVKESVRQGKPIVFVAVNYRVSGFGFMPGAEILADGSANLGLLDQRLGLKWVADNIEAFGGDPEKVTIWGESAGAISVASQMIMYDGDHTYKDKPLFRGAIMNSGSGIPTDPVDCPKGQTVYDGVVRHAGCDTSPDTLECLRGLDYDTMLDAVNSQPSLLSYHSVALSYLPRPDGVVLTESPDILLKKGKYARVPFIIGDQEDEGTLFALMQPNITTKAQISDYLSDLFFHNAEKSTLDNLVATYQTITTDGSPFRTGILNNWYPQFKRIAALLGDLTFTITRRVVLEIIGEVSPEVPSWSYLATYNYGTPIMGTFHGSDILQVFHGIWPNYAARTIRGYYFNFVYNLDPNDGKLPTWPQWKEKRQLAEFQVNRVKLMIDDFRADTFEFLKKNIKQFYF